MGVGESAMKRGGGTCSQQMASAAVSDWVGPCAYGGAIRFRGESRFRWHDVHNCVAAVQIRHDGFGDRYAASLALVCSYVQVECRDVCARSLVWLYGLKTVAESGKRLRTLCSASEDR